VVAEVGVWVVYAVACGNGIGVATSFLLPWAMLPDTIDDSELRSVSTKHHTTLLVSAAASLWNALICSLLALSCWHINGCGAPS